MTDYLSIHDLIKLEHRIMARIDELTGAVESIKESVTRALAEIDTWKAAHATAIIEDPRIGEAVDALNAARVTIDAIVPPPVVAAEEPAA